MKKNIKIRQISNFACAKLSFCIEKVGRLPTAWAIAQTCNIQFLKKYFISIIKIISITLTLLFLIQCKDPVETKCESACKFFVKCTEENNKMKITGEILNTATIQCIDGCTRYQSEILSCYAEESDSCQGMVECMLQSGLGD